MTATEARSLMASSAMLIEEIDIDIRDSARSNCAWVEADVDNLLKDEIMKHYRDNGFKVEEKSITASFSTIKIRW